MLFLIEYDRRAGRIVTMQKFDDAHAREAHDVRLALELTRNREGIDREVVLLDAADEAAVRRTHRRYFANLAELATLPPLNGESQK